MKVFGAKITEDVVRGLSTTYKFSFEEAMKGLKVEVKEKKEKKETKKKGSSIPLPFCGVISESDCQAIRLNHGLYTQCTNDIVETINGRGLCSTCEKQIQKNTNKLPTYGYITERVEKGATFRDPKGKSPVNYGNIMEKLNISRNTAEREAANQGLTIPEKQFEVKKAQRGRPKKDATAADTSGSEDNAPKVEKKRGRPKKERKIVSAMGDDLINGLSDEVNSMVAEKADSDVDNEEEESSAENIEEVGVVEVSISGKKYWLSEDDKVYDKEDWREIGKLNKKTQEIESGESDSD
jgi:hypothetical protein